MLCLTIPIQVDITWNLGHYLYPLACDRELILLKDNNLWDRFANNPFSGIGPYQSLIGCWEFCYRNALQFLVVHMDVTFLQFIQNFDLDTYISKEILKGSFDYNLNVIWRFLKNLGIFGLESYWINNNLTECSAPKWNLMNFKIPRIKP